MRDGTWLDKEADTYYEKLGIQCATAEEFKRWFKAAQKCYVTAGPEGERKSFKTGKRLKSFCQDCTNEYAQQQLALGRCINPLVQINGSLENCELNSSPTTAK